MNNSPLLFNRIWRAQGDAAANLADGAGASAGSGALHLRTCCAIPALRTWWRTAPSAHGADHPGPCGYFDDASLHAFGAGSLENGVSEASSPGEGKMKEFMAENTKGIVAKAVADFLRHLRERNASPHTVKAYKQDLTLFAAYAGRGGGNRLTISLCGISFAAL